MNFDTVTATVTAQASQDTPIQTSRTLGIIPDTRCRIAGGSTSATPLRIPDIESSGDQLRSDLPPAMRQFRAVPASLVGRAAHNSGSVCFDQRAMRRERACCCLVETRQLRGRSIEEL